MDLNEKRLKHVESRVDRLSGRSEKTVIKLTEKEIARRKREKFGKQMREDTSFRKAKTFARARESFEKNLLDQRMKLYAGQNA